MAAWSTFRRAELESAAPLCRRSQEAWLRVGSYKLFGSVRWALDAECGVEFFEPLGGQDVAQVLAQARR